jgi:hypothetical protein
MSLNLHLSTSWRQLRSLVMRGPQPNNDPYRENFQHVAPIGFYNMAHVPWQRTRGGDAVAIGVPYPFNNPIGAGIVFREQGAIFGPPPARYAFGALFFDYPTPGQSIPETVQPGGPLYDPATLAALIGAPDQAGAPTTPAIGAAQAGASRMNMSF